MKKNWLRGVLCLALALTMLACSALAAAPVETAAATGATVSVDADGKYTVTVNNLTADAQYALLQVRTTATGDTAAALLASATTASYTVGENTILYIDQDTATSGTVTFSGFQPMAGATSLFVLGGGTEPQIVGAVLASGVTVSGTAIAKVATTGNVTVTLKSGETVVGTDTVTTGETYTIDAVPAGNYTMTVSSDIKGEGDKVKYVTRTYDVTVGDADVTQNVELWPKGDANGDGRVAAGDTTAIFNHLRLNSTNVLTGYALDCANVNGDTRVTAGDTTAIFNHLRIGSTNKLW